jgi:hypothetical protein
MLVAAQEVGLLVALLGLFPQLTFLVLAHQGQAALPVSLCEVVMILFTSTK